MRLWSRRYSPSNLLVLAIPSLGAASSRGTKVWVKPSHVSRGLKIADILGSTLVANIHCNTSWGSILIQRIHVLRYEYNQSVQMYEKKFKSIVKNTAYGKNKPFCLGWNCFDGWLIIPSIVIEVEMKAVFILQKTGYIVWMLYVQ